MNFEMHNIIFIGFQSALSKYLSERLLNTQRNAYFLSNSYDNSSFENVFGFEEIGQLIENCQGNNKSYSIVNIASLVPSNCNRASDFFEINCSKIPNAIQCLCEKLNVTHVMIASTMDIFSHSEKVITQNTQPNPSTIYGGSKHWQEVLIKEITRSFGAKFLTLRLPLLMVPNGKNNFIFKWMHAIKNNLDINITNHDSYFNNFADGRLIYDILDSFIFVLSYSFPTVSLLCPFTFPRETSPTSPK